MSRQFGGFRSSYESVLVSPTDPDGVPLLSTSNEFGASPMGLALLQQVRLGLPNATFNLLPPDPSLPIVELDNPLPYWQIQTTDNITATPLYDTTAQTWGIYINPGTAPSGDYITLKTRSWVSTDDNFNLRQKASLVLSKVGSYAGATQWNTTLTAVYYAIDNTAVSTAVIGTVYDNTTWTSIAGTTTTGGSAVPASAAWAEFTIKLTATSNITSSTGVTLKSLTLGSSSPIATGFLVTDTFTASGTWTRPTNVTTLTAVVAVGGGGGGAGGQVRALDKVALGAGTSFGGASGGSSSWALIQNLYVGDVSSVSVGIGTAGAGGTANAFSKAATGTARAGNSAGNPNLGGSGGAGGASTFGAYLSVPGGGGAVPAYLSAGTGGTAAGTSTTTVLGATTLVSVAGTGAASNGNNSTASAYSYLPFWSQTYVAGSAGVAGTGSGGSSGSNGAGGAGGTAGIIGSGGGGARTVFDGGATMTAGAAGLGGSGGAGGGGGGEGRYGTGTVTLAGTAGNGGLSALNTGAGGAGGGAAIFVVDTSANYVASTITARSGAGADGGAGIVLVVYVS
jgi:hypothetical protein